MAAAARTLKFTPSARALKQMCLTKKHGGLGFRSWEGHAAGAYLASVSFARSVDGGEWESFVGVGEAAERYNSRVAGHRVIALGNAVWEQRALSEAVEEKDFAAVQSLYAEDGDAARAHFLSVCHGSAGKWLSVRPSKDLGFSMPSAMFCLLILWWLHENIIGERRPCPRCGVVMDTKGLHALLCRTGGHLGIRHDAVKNVFMGLCQRVGYSPRSEVHGAIRGTGQRPGDITTIEGSLQVATDFCVTHPCQDKYLEHTLRDPSAAVRMYAQEHKIDRYKVLCAANGIGFRAGALSVFGVPSEELNAFMAQIAATMAASTNQSKAVVMEQIRRRVSMP
jgi:hypothetical protein